MARNRKREDVALRWGTLVRSLLASFVIAGLGIGYVRQTMVQDRLGREQIDLERYQVEVDRKLQRQEAVLSQLKSEAGLRQLMQRHRLDLANTPAARRIYLPAPVVTNRAAQLVRSRTPAGRAATGSALATLNPPTRP